MRVLVVVDAQKGLQTADKELIELFTQEHIARI